MANDLVDRLRKAAEQAARGENAAASAMLLAEAANELSAIGKKDFDYISMKDYCSDTKEIVDHAGNALRYQRDLLQEKAIELERFEFKAKKLVAELVIKAGGKITITRPDYYTNDFNLIISVNQADDTITYEAKHMSGSRK